MAIPIIRIKTIVALSRWDASIKARVLKKRNHLQERTFITLYAIESAEKKQPLVGEGDKSDRLLWISA
jgi:hypothetical protein